MNFVHVSCLSVHLSSVSIRSHQYADTNHSADKEEVADLQGLDKQRDLALGVAEHVHILALVPVLKESCRGSKQN
jgi:hypothetical protein